MDFTEESKDKSVRELRMQLHWKISKTYKAEGNKIGNGFSRTERLMHVSHVSVINWVKKAAEEIRKKRKFKQKKTNILGLDEMCINFKKNIWLWTAANRATKKLVSFFVGDRRSESFGKLCENISHIETKFYATDKFPVYDIIPPNKHLIGKSHTYNVERMNRLLRHYLARFSRKTYCCSRSLSMISFSVSLFSFFC